MITVAQNSPIRCNRCSSKFNAPKDMPRDEFRGQSAARVQAFCTCPACNQTDCHYVYATDIMPAFEGSDTNIRKMQKAWKEEN